MKTFNKTVSIIIPVYNEKETVEKVISKVREAAKDIIGPKEIVLVDDGSDDGLEHDKLKPMVDNFLVHKENRGYGAAIKTGLREAQGDTIVIIDADATYPAQEIPRLIKALDNCDMAVGARTGEKVNVPLLRQPAKFILTKLANYLADTKIPDLNSGLRAFRKKEALRFLHLLPRGFSLTATLTLAFLCNDLRVEYLPIDYYKRLGKSKIRPVGDTRDILITIIRTVLFFNPLKVCIPLSVILFGLALAVLLFSALALERVMDGTVAVLTLTGVQVLVIGMLADLIARRSAP